MALTKILLLGLGIAIVFAAFLTLTEYYVPSSDAPEPEPVPPAPRLEFMPGVNNSDFVPVFVESEGYPGWAYQLPDNVVIVSPVDGLLFESYALNPSVYFRSYDGWGIALNASSFNESFFDESGWISVTRGQPLFNVAQRQQVLIQVLKEDPSCANSFTQKCPFVDPASYFS